MKQCKECGNDFEPKAKKQVFCSSVCKQKGYRKSVAKKLEGYKKQWEEKENNPKIKIKEQYVPFEKPKQTEWKVIEKEITEELYCGLSDYYEIERLEERLVILKKELLNPPSNILIGKKMYETIRRNEIFQIKTKLNNHDKGK